MVEIYFGLWNSNILLLNSYNCGGDKRMDLKTRLIAEIENCQKMIDSFEPQWSNGDAGILYWKAKKELAEQLLSEDVESDQGMQRIKKRFGIFVDYITLKESTEVEGNYKHYLRGQLDAMTFAKQSVEEELGKDESINGNHTE